jgi:hypothetical protein
VGLTVKPVGKPDAGNPHVRFDERGGETDRLCSTALLLDSTRTSAVGDLRTDQLIGTEESIKGKSPRPILHADWPLQSHRESWPEYALTRGDLEIGADDFATVVNEALRQAGIEGVEEAQRLTLDPSGKITVLKGS